MKGREMLRDIYAEGSGKTLEASRTSSFNFSFEQKAGFPVPNFVPPGAQIRLPSPFTSGVEFLFAN